MKNLFDEIKRYNDKTIIMCGTTMYHILLSIMIMNKCKCFDNSLLFLFSYRKSEINEFKRIEHKLSHHGVRIRVFNKKSKIYRLLKLTDISMAKEYKSISREYGINNGDFLLINFAWSFKRIQYPASILFDKCRSAIFVQDGATQYLYPRESRLFLLFKKIYDCNKEFWTNEKLKWIYAEHPDKYPVYLQCKMRHLQVTELNNNIYDVLKDVFDIEETSLNYMKKADGIIFTQPLSEDRLVSEKEKLMLYDSISKFYSKYGSVCLKVHPRDCTEYECLGIPIIYDKVPSEIVSLLGIHFHFAIGIFTSAVDTANADIKVNLEERFPECKKVQLIPLEDIMMNK